MGRYKWGSKSPNMGFKYTYSLHCSSFWGLPFGILSIELVKPQKGTTTETIGSYPTYNP